jgi:hypothetical protein
MISIDWAAKVIHVPKADLTLVGGNLYELDTNAFRVALKDLEDDPDGMPFPDTHRHNSEVTVAGTTFARVIEIINGYSVEFENGSYTVVLLGSNNNIFDAENGILVQNTVQIIAQNSAGLIVSAAETASDIADAVLAASIEPTTSMVEALRLILATQVGKLSGAAGTTITIRDIDDTKDRIVATVDADGNRIAVATDGS